LEPFLSFEIFSGADCSQFLPLSCEFKSEKTNKQTNDNNKNGLGKKYGKSIEFCIIDFV